MEIIHMLLSTESAAEFEQLRKDFFDEIRPQGVIEREYVHDMVCLTWDVLRYRRGKAGVINAVLMEALESILKHLVPLPPPHDLGAIHSWPIEELGGRAVDIKQFKRKWFDPKKKAQVIKLLQQYGLDEATVEAEAFRLRSEDLERFERMQAHAEARRHKALRMIEERRKEMAERLRQTSNKVLQKDEAPPIAPVLED
jgi:hypothetical protein